MATHAHWLIGRQSQQDALMDAVDAARRSNNVTVLVTGQPGAGKTSLLNDLQSSVADITLLEVTGVESERAYPLAALISLLAGHRDLVDGVRSPHGPVLSRIVDDGRADSVPVMGLALLELIATLSDEQPVLLMIDDLHWLDQLSVEVIAFACRRLQGHRVATVVATRPGSSFPIPDVIEIELEGLDTDAAFAILAASGPVDSDVARMCRDASGGNPLAIIETGRLLTTDQRRGVSPFPSSVPAGASLHRWLAERVEALPEATRRGLLVVALTSNLSRPLRTRVFLRLGIDPAVLDDAEDAHVIRRNDEEVEFTHPLYASIAVDDAHAGDRRAAHRMIAAALGEGASERQAWHLADGCECEADLNLAVDALRTVAHQAISRGAHLVASSAFQRAADLLDDDGERSEALISAGQAAWDAGRPELAVPLLRTARDLVPPGATRAVATDALGQVLGWASSVPEACRLLEAEVAHVEGDRPELAVALLISAARLASLAASTSATDLTARAEQIAERADDLTKVTARTIATHVRLIGGEGDTLADRLDELDELNALIDGELSRPLIELGQLLAFDLMVREQWSDARAMFTRVISAARVGSFPGMETFALAMSGEVAWRTGRWTDARAEASADAAFHERFEHLRGSFGDATQARVEAAVGLGESARRHAQLAIDRGDALEMASLSAWGRHALGLALLADGQPDEATEPLEWIWHLERAGGATDPGVLWWHGDLLEVLLATERRRDAERFIRQLDDHARATGRTWAAAVVARGRGILGADPGELARSVRLFVELGAPFEARRSQLALGEMLTGTERNAALDDALDGFERLGARPWIERTRSIRADSSPSPNRPSTAAALSPAELRVAVAIGRGLSNRDAATSLALSPRTIDAHLQSIYRKLDIRTRSQLVIHMHAFGN